MKRDDLVLIAMLQGMNDDELTVEQFRRRCVEPMGEESDHVALVALSDMLLVRCCPKSSFHALSSTSIYLSTACLSLKAVVLFDIKQVVLEEERRSGGGMVHHVASPEGLKMVPAAGQHASLKPVDLQRN